jgi:hypothetical protein
MNYNYVSRIRGESDRPPYTPAGFRSGLSQLEAELTPKFIETANLLSESGEAEVILAIAELSKRLRVMGQTINPRTAPHNIGNLLSCIESAMAWPKYLEQDEPQINSLQALQFEIVHTPDKIRHEMEEHRFITPLGNRLLKKIDFESQYYKLPQIDTGIIEMGQ